LTIDNLSTQKTKQQQRFLLLLCRTCYLCLKHVLTPLSHAFLQYIEYQFDKGIISPVWLGIRIMWLSWLTCLPADCCSSELDPRIMWPSWSTCLLVDCCSSELAPRIMWPSWSTCLSEDCCSSELAPITNLTKFV
jgi:hypothetical protein